MRIPADLKDRLDLAAEESHRSLTAEVVDRLQRSLDDSTDARTQAAMLTEIYDLLDRQKAEQERSLPTVLATLEKELASAAVERWTLRTQLHDASHITQGLVKALDHGEKLTDEQREQVMEIATRWCQGADHHNDPLESLQHDLEAASAKAESLGTLAAQRFLHAESSARDEILAAIGPAPSPNARRPAGKKSPK